MAHIMAFKAVAPCGLRESAGREVQRLVIPGPAGAVRFPGGGRFFRLA